MKELELLAQNRKELELPLLLEQNRKELEQNRKELEPSTKVEEQEPLELSKKDEELAPNTTEELHIGRLAQPECRIAF